VHEVGSQETCDGASVSDVSGEIAPECVVSDEVLVDWVWIVVIVGLTILAGNFSFLELNF